MNCDYSEALHPTLPVIYVWTTKVGNKCAYPSFQWTVDFHNSPILIKMQD